jgi:hypothetical protein
MRRAALALVLVAAALVLAGAAHDVHAWQSASAHRDGRVADTWLPRDPVRRVLGLEEDRELTRAIRSFRTAYTTGNGFDNGLTRNTRRSVAEVRLSDVAAHADAADASQAGGLLGVLVVSGGRVTGGITADDRARAAFETAIRRDPSNAAAKYDLELLLRRTRATSTRQGPGNGSGVLGQGRRGAGSGTPGRGY